MLDKVIFPFRLSAVIALLVGLAWILILTNNDEDPAITSLFSGCYRSQTGSDEDRIVLTASGAFNYQTYTTTFVAYREKSGLALLPRGKVLAGADGHLSIGKGHPLLLHVDPDNMGFTVPSEVASDIKFRRVRCETP